MKFTMDFPLEVEIIWPTDSRIGKIMLSHARSPEPYPSEHFEKVTAEDEGVGHMWLYERKYYWSEERLVEAIKEHLKKDWRLTR